ncbi:hypothetical protein GCM10023189_33760 [Nibrella saemangeumensis]|uniref:DUF5683 domain-containing protein n=1 Tax=Nibrella saemangeumensis TaxID=1084526 RepID=A0ABP8N5T3_9BACT
MRAFGQVPGQTQPDSTRSRVPTDRNPVRPAATVQRDTIPVGNSQLISVGDSIAPGVIDTTRLTKIQTAKIQKIVPKKATLLSLALPGLGQAYNRQYWKIPIIYGGFAIFGYNIVSFNQRFKEFETGYRTAYNSTGTKTAFVRGREYSVQQLKLGYDTYRRWRDLNIILSVAFWAVNAVEANVAAHLRTFDLSDDLSLRVRPGMQRMPGSRAIPGVQLTFHLKK